MAQVLTPPNGTEARVRTKSDAEAISSVTDEQHLWDVPPPTECAGFNYTELATATHGPFGPLTGRENLLRENGFSRTSLPLFTAISCCFAADLSFPTAWCADCSRHPTRNPATLASVGTSVGSLRGGAGTTSSSPTVTSRV